MDTKGERGGENCEIGTDTYTLLILCIKQITSETYWIDRELCLMHCGGLNGKDIPKGMADPPCCTVETNTTF